MKLSVRHTYPCTPERYWEMYWDDGFDTKLQQDSTVARELVEESDDERCLTRRLRFTPHDELPKPAAKLIGTSKLVYDQLNVWDREAGVLTWEVLPTFISSDRFEAKGDFRVLPHAQGCELVVDGDIDVKVRFIGGTIESRVVEQIEQAYENMRIVSLAWLEENRGEPSC